MTLEDGTGQENLHSFAERRERPVPRSLDFFERISTICPAISLALTLAPPTPRLRMSVHTASKPVGGPKLHTFNIPQVVAAGQVQDLPLLPSFLYIPGPHDLAPGSIDLPWKKNPPDTCGVFARNHGAKVPGRQVSSAKSWLCHPGVDRTAPLLPWAGPPDVPRLSPLEVSARYLKHIVEAWNAAHGRKAADHLENQEVVITVPASFDDVARNLTAEAAKQAGMKHVTLLE